MTWWCILDLLQMLETHNWKLVLRTNITTPVMLYLHSQVKLSSWSMSYILGLYVTHYSTFWSYSTHLYAIPASFVTCDNLGKTKTRGFSGNSWFSLIRKPYSGGLCLSADFFVVFIVYKDLYQWLIQIISLLNFILYYILALTK